MAAVMLGFMFGERLGGGLLVVIDGGSGGVELAVTMARVSSRV